MKLTPEQIEALQKEAEENAKKAADAEAKVTELSTANETLTTELTETKTWLEELKWKFTALEEEKTKKKTHKKEEDGEYKELYEEEKLKNSELQTKYTQKSTELEQSEKGNKELVGIIWEKFEAEYNWLTKELDEDTKKEVDGLIDLNNPVASRWKLWRISKLIAWRKETTGNLWWSVKWWGKEDDNPDFKEMWKKEGRNWYANWKEKQFGSKNV